MVSEVLRLSSRERQRLAEQACRLGPRRGAVVVSVGAESSHTAEGYARHAESVGADAVMAVPPIAVALGEEQLLDYYRRILQAVEIPVIVQDASGYVGRPMSIALLARLLDEFGPRVLFKPEAVPIGPRLSELHAATGGQARVFEGTGGIALVDSFRRGIVGTMPGADLIDGSSRCGGPCKPATRREADRIWLPLAALVSLQHSLDAFLAIEKHLLVRQGVFTNTLVRGPVGYTLDDADAPRGRPAVRPADGGRGGIEVAAHDAVPLPTTESCNVGRRRMQGAWQRMHPARAALTPGR